MENITSFNETEYLCVWAKIISDRIELRIIYILECVLGLAVLLPNLLTLYLLWKVKIFHANLRLILANLTCNLSVYSLSTTIKAFQRLTQDPCQFSMLLKTCIAVDYSVAIPVQNTLISLVILSLERLYATIRFRTYDYAGSIPYLAMILLAGGWAITLILNIPSYINAPSSRWIAICETALAASPRAVTKIIITLCILETIAAVITTYVFIYNRYLHKHTAINQALYHLSARFQINQNVQVNRALMPGMILHLIFYTPTYFLLAMVYIGDTGADTGTKAWLLHLTFLWRLLYALIDPILLITVNRNLRNAAKKTTLGKLLMGISNRLMKRKKTKTDDANLQALQVMNLHFALLEQAWGIEQDTIRPPEKRKVKVAFT